MRVSVFLFWISTALAIAVFGVSLVDSEIAGLNGRIAREVSEKVKGARVWFVSIASELPELLKRLSTGEIDVLVGVWRSGFEGLVFSDYPVYAVNHYLIHRTGEKPPRKIGVLDNTEAESLVRRLSDHEPMVYDDATRMIEDLENERLDAVLIDSIRAKAILKNLKGLEYKRVFGKSYRFLALSPKTADQFLEKIDSALKGMYRDDTLKEIINDLDLGESVMPPDELLFVNSEWPPYEYLESGEWKGTDVEVLKAVLNRMGYEIEIKECPWLRCLEMIRTGIADGTFTLERTKDREEYMIFSDEPISYGRDVLFHLRGLKVDFSMPGDYRCGYVPGYAYQEYLKRIGFKLVKVRDDETGMRLVSMGRLDLFMADLNVGIYYARKLGILDRISWTKPLRMYPSYVAFSRILHHRALARDFSKELRAFKREGGYLGIFREYDLLKIRGVGR